MLDDNKIASKAFLFISTISLGTMAFILAVLFSLRIKDNSPKISPDSIFPIFFPSISATSPPEITKRLFLLFRPLEQYIDQVELLSFLNPFKPNFYLEGCNKDTIPIFWGRILLYSLILSIIIS